MREIRLFISSKIVEDTKILLTADQTHYLANVLRMKIGDEILIFNGCDGKWSARILDIQKKSAWILPINMICQYENPSVKIKLVFTPARNVKDDLIVRYGCELGVTEFQPILTDRSVVKSVNYEKLEDAVVASIQQCERIDIPKINKIISLNEYLKNAIDECVVICDESGAGLKAGEVLTGLQSVSVVVGPEGGFSDEEFTRFSKIPNLRRISLGKRILKVDTAICSVLALIGEFVG